MKTGGEKMFEYLMTSSRYNENKYYVADILPNDKIKMLFILESPGENECRKNIPVCGKSGIVMAHHLLPTKSNESFGEYVKEHLNLGVAIVNVSNVALQSYKGINEKLVPDSLNKMRKAIANDNKKDQLRYKDEIELLCKIFNYKLLKENIKNKICNKTIVVSCGRFAGYYWTHSNLFRKGKNIPVPHPSYGWWSRKENEIDEVKEAFIDLIYSNK
jgi:hypothetical protein